MLDWDEAGTGLSAIDLGYPLICEFLTEDLIWHGELAEASSVAIKRPLRRRFPLRMAS